MKFIVRNFQSLKEVKIDASGFTLVVGQTGEGKSATFRALKAACVNKFSKGNVKHGEKSATVAIQTDGHTLVATKPDNGSPSYALDGQVFSKLNRTVPEPVADLLNMSDLSEGSYSLNFYPQFEAPLLVGFSQKKVLELLSASQGLDDLNTVKTELSVKRSETNGAFKSLDSILSSLKVQSSDLEEQVNQMQPIMESVNAKWSELQEVIETSRIFNELMDVVEQTERMSSQSQSYALWCDSMEKVAQEHSSNSETLSYVTELASLLDTASKDAERKERVIEEGLALKAVVTNRDSADIVSKQLLDITSLTEYLQIQSEYDARFKELSEIVDGKVCPCCGRPLEECTEHGEIQGSLFV